jgi:methyl-accepting chemotaxis protein
MSIKQELQKHYGAASAEQKLAVLRRELTRPILTVQSSANLLNQAGPQITNCLPVEMSPDEFNNMVKWLNDAARDLQDILDALTEDAQKVQVQHGKE